MTETLAHKAYNTCYLVLYRGNLPAHGLDTYLYLFNNIKRLLYDSPKPKNSACYVTFLIYFYVLDLRWREKENSMTWTLPSTSISSLLLLVLVSSGGTQKLGGGRKGGGEMEKEVLWDAAMSKLQGMSINLLDNVLEYGTSTPCQTLISRNQAGCEIFICRLLVYKLWSKHSK